MTGLGDSTGAEAPESLVEAGRAALARRAWEEAYDLLSRAAAQGELSGHDLEALAEAAFFSARPGEIFDIKERAFRAHLAAGDTVRAAYVAFDVAYAYGMDGKPSMAAGWTRRGERLTEGQPENYTHGYLALLRSELAKSRGELEVAVEQAERAVEISSRTGHNDLGGWPRARGPRFARRTRSA